MDIPETGKKWNTFLEIQPDGLREDKCNAWRGMRPEIMRLGDTDGIIKKTGSAVGDKKPTISHFAPMKVAFASVFSRWA